MDALDESWASFSEQEKKKMHFLWPLILKKKAQKVSKWTQVNDDNIVLIVKVDASKADDNTKRKLAMDMKVGEIVKKLTAVDSPLLNNYKQSSSDSLEGLLCCLIAY